MTCSEDGHPGLWWAGGDVPDEAPGVRAKYAEEFAKVPKPRAVIPTRDQILARGGSRG